MQIRTTIEINEFVRNRTITAKCRKIGSRNWSVTLSDQDGETLPLTFAIWDTGQPTDLENLDQIIRALTQARTEIAYDRENPVPTPISEEN